MKTQLWRQLAEGAERLQKQITGAVFTPLPAGVQLLPANASNLSGYA